MEQTTTQNTDLQPKRNLNSMLYCRTEMVQYRDAVLSPGVFRAKEMYQLGWLLDYILAAVPTIPDSYQAWEVVKTELGSLRLTCMDEYEMQHYQTITLMHPGNFPADEFAITWWDGQLILPNEY